MTDDARHLRIGPLCEATCGLRLDMVGDRVARVTGDADDVVSHAYLSPRGVAIGDLHDDPDEVDPLSGDALLNGIPVTVTHVPAPAVAQRR